MFLLYAIFVLIGIEIIFNWIYKKEDNKKDLVNGIINTVETILPIIYICTTCNFVIYYIFASIMIACGLYKLAFSNWGLLNLRLEESKKTQIKKHFPLAKTISLYLETLTLIVAMCFVWQKLTYILVAIAFILFLVMIHEFGHYIAGKILGFKIEEFSVGFGPAIFQKTKSNGEKISLRVFPLGGYCAFAGENEEATDPMAFNNQKPWKRLIVLSAGVLFNFLFGLIACVVYLSVSMYSLPKVIMTADNQTILRQNDVILAVDGNKIDYYRLSKTSLNQYADLVFDYGANEEFVLTVLRDGQKQDVVVKKEYRDACRYVIKADNLKGKLFLKEDENNFTLISDDDVLNYIRDLNNELNNVYRYDDDTSSYVLYSKEEILLLGQISEANSGNSLGIVITNEYYDYTFGQAILYAVPTGLDMCWLILKVFGGIFTGATAISDLGGTITSVDAIAEFTQIDWSYLLYLMPLLAMNLAVFNILPIPALDGAGMVFVLIEMIRRKPINKNIQGTISFIGLMLLFSFVIFLDVYHFFIL